jgi:signal transduction histidine kinase
MNLPRFGVSASSSSRWPRAQYRRAVHGRAPVRRAARRRDWVNHTQDAANLIARIYRGAVDAENGAARLPADAGRDLPQPYIEARAEVPKDLEALGKLTSDNPVQVGQLATVASSSTPASRRWSARSSSSATATTRPPPVHDVADGMVTMTRCASRSTAWRPRSNADERRDSGADRNQNQLRRGFYLLAGSTCFSSRWAAFSSARNRSGGAGGGRGRRAQRAARAAVNERTAELSGLSHHLQRLQEERKAKIAAGNHDELGGTLAAAKIDLQLISDKLPHGRHPSHASRPHHVAIDDTIQVKRRIIEDLRPTLLDNLGIGAALKWQCSQFSKRWNIRAGSKCRTNGLRLSPAYSIAFYRVVQEALTNISKYAHAEERVRSRCCAGATAGHCASPTTASASTRRRPHNTTAHGSSRCGNARGLWAANSAFAVSPDAARWSRSPLRSKRRR